MRKQQKVFLFIALVYCIYKIFNLFFGRTYISTSSLIPGWHTVIEYRPIYTHSFAIVYFLAIAAVYGLRNLTFTNLFLWIHAVLSIVPLIAMILWPLFFNDTGIYIDSVATEYKVSELLEWFFIISQAVFVLLIIFRQIKSEKLCATNQL